MGRSRSAPDQRVFLREVLARGLCAAWPARSDLPFTGGETKKRASLLGQYVAFLNWPLWVKAQFVPGKGACDLTGEKTAGWLRSLRAPYGEKENNNQRWSHYHPETKIRTLSKDRNKAT